MDKEQKIEELEPVIREADRVRQLAKDTAADIFKSTFDRRVFKSAVAKGGGTARKVVLAWYKRVMLPYAIDQMQYAKGKGYNVAKKRA